MTTNRIEAFSDGVIAIIITIMVFDLKVPEIAGGINSANVWRVLLSVLPKFISYLISFIILAIIWINHHQMFQQIKKSSITLLWLNNLLLFCLSLIPFSTNFIGANPLLPEAEFFYGIIFFMNATSFWLLRNYAIKAKLVSEKISERTKQRIRVKNLLSIAIYLFSAFSGYISPYISFILFIIVPAIYFIPEKITTEN
ncbi:MAG: TMEM175 family protein [Thermoflexibacter sp.]|jgi:uncharacterized membrane protein|nr:TMEM175 family protein [Thermoflexibacter sp.]